MLEKFDFTSVEQRNFQCVQRLCFRFGSTACYGLWLCTTVLLVCQRRATALTVSAPAYTGQVFEFSYFYRAGLVSVATEPAAQVSRPDTPFPEQSSQAAGVSDFTPSRPGVVVIHDMSAGPSTSGVLGGGPAQQAIGDGPVSR